MPGQRTRPSRGRQALTAAASRIEVRLPAAEAARPVAAETSWKDEAWSYFDSVPEVKFAARFLGNSLSRLRFYPAVVLDPDEAPVSLDDAASEPGSGVSQALADAATEEMERLNSGPEGGMAGLQRSWGVCLSMTGDSYLVARDVEGEETWQVFSDSAIAKTGDRYGVRQAPGATPEPLPEDAFLSRIWRRHDRWPGMSDSNMRAVLDVCEELLIYGRQFRAVGRSRNNAGMLLLPNELDFDTERIPPTSDDPGSAPTDDAADEKDELTPLESGIVQSLIQPTADDGSPSQVVPHLLRGPLAALAGVRHISLDRKIDEQAIARMVHLIQRLAHGIEVPPEVLTGVADANHWNVWQIEDSTYKSNVEPLASIPAHGLAVVFLRPALLARGFSMGEVGRVMVGIDPAALVVRPNRGADARDAFDRLALSYDALRRYLGFPDADAPGPDEYAARLTAESGAGAQASPVDGGLPTPASPAAALLASAAPGDGLGERLAAIDTRLRERLQIAASDALTAALARAGSRLRTRAQGDPDLARLVLGQPNDRVGQALGEAGPQLAASEELLSAADFDQLGERWTAWAGQARSEALAAARRSAVAAGLSGDNFDELAAAELASAPDDDREGWLLLLAALLALGASRIFSPDASPDDGEFDPLVAVPPGPVREALARAGGATAAVGAPDALGLGAASGGPASGRVMIRVLERAGAVEQGWRWDVGMPTFPFPPHQALAGLVFRSWDDAALTNSGGFPHAGHFYPGDHKGCQCDAVPILVFAASGKPAVAV